MNTCASEANRIVKLIDHLFSERMSKSTLGAFIAGGFASWKGQALSADDLKAKEKLYADYLVNYAKFALEEAFFYLIRKEEWFPSIATVIKKTEEILSGFRYLKIQLLVFLQTREDTTDWTYPHLLSLYLETKKTLDDTQKEASLSARRQSMQVEYKPEKDVTALFMKKEKKVSV